MSLQTPAPVRRVPGPFRSRRRYFLAPGSAADEQQRGTASTALASVGPQFFSPEQAGYAATGAHFKYVQTSVKLPDASQFATNVAGFGFSVQLRTKFRVVVLGLSNTTTPGDYSAAVAVFNRTTHSLICSTASASKPCPNVPSGWTSGKVSFPPG